MAGTMGLMAKFARIASSSEGSDVPRGAQRHLVGNCIVQGDGRLHAVDQPSQPLARHRPFARLDGGVVDVADEIEEGTRGSQIIATQDGLPGKWIWNAIVRA